MFKDYPIFLNCISRIFLQFDQLKSRFLNLTTNWIFIDFFLQFFKAVEGITSQSGFHPFNCEYFYLHWQYFEGEYISRRPTKIWNKFQIKLGYFSNFVALSEYTNFITHFDLFLTLSLVQPLLRSPPIFDSSICILIRIQRPIFVLSLYMFLLNNTLLLLQIICLHS